MKAFALTSADQPASLVDLPDPEPVEGAVRVRLVPKPESLSFELTAAIPLAGATALDSVEGARSS